MPGIDAQAGQARFLLRLAQRVARQVAVAVGMAAQLQPHAELAVVGQQHPRAAAVDQPRRRGEVAVQPFAHERIAGIGQQGQEFIGARRLRPASAAR